jgi:predicted RNA binding protein YcfA (HicA-like mRNA interferase family)
VKWSELIKLLKQNGCYKENEGANHEIWFSPKTNATFPVGRHKSEEVPQGTLNAILKQSGIKE